MRHTVAARFVARTVGGYDEWLTPALAAIVE